MRHKEKLIYKLTYTQQFCRSVRLKTGFTQQILIKVTSVKFKKLSMLYLRIPGHRSINRHDLHITRSIYVCKERQNFKFISKERQVVHYQNEWPNAL